MSLPAFVLLYGAIVGLLFCMVFWLVFQVDDGSDFYRDR